MSSEEVDLDSVSSEEDDLYSVSTDEDDVEVDNVWWYSSKRMQWDILNFFSEVEKAPEYKFTKRTEISIWGCKWKISFDTEGIANGRLVVQVVSENKKIGAKKTVACYVGSKRADLSEKLTSEAEEADLNAKVWIFVCPFGLEELKRRKTELVQYDTLIITLYLEDIYSNPRKEDIGQLIEFESLSCSFEDLLVHKKKTDFTIKVKGKDFPVHKAVLVARSPVFSAMFGHDTSEERTGVVIVPDCDPGSFQCFLRYLYTGKLDCVNSSNAHHLYETSEKYDVQALKPFCVQHMNQNLTMENVLDVIALADRYEESKLMSAAQDYFNHNFLKVISTSRWRILMREDPGLVCRLLQQRETEVKNVAKRVKLF